jgi:acyl-CoA reductase-like NAD-dependent aldehyde dehydrogenase
MVKASVFDEFIEELKKAFEVLLGGNVRECTTYSRIITHAHYDRLTGLYTKQLEVPGTKVVYGGEQDREQKLFGPTVLVVDPQQSNPVLQEEIFGPLFPVFKFEDVRQAAENVERISPRPLAMYPFSSSKMFIETLIRDVSAGGVVANDVLVHLSIEGLPFGGVGTSGLGTYHGRYSFETFTRPQAIMIRNSKFDLHNRIRYPHVMGARENFVMKLLRIYLAHPIYSNFTLALRNFYRAIGGRQTIFMIIAFIVGFKFAQSRSI